MPRWSDDGYDDRDNSNYSTTPPSPKSWYDNFKVPDYLQTAIDRAKSPSIQADRYSSASLQPTLAGLINNQNTRAGFLNTGLSGGFQDKSIANSDLAYSLKLSDIFATEKAKFEQEQLSLDAELYNMQTTFAQQQEQASMMSEQLRQNQAKFNYDNSFVGWLRDLL